MTARVRAGSRVTLTSASPDAARSVPPELDWMIAAGTRPAARVKNVRRFIVVANFPGTSSVQGFTGLSTTTPGTVAGGLSSDNARAGIGEIVLLAGPGETHLSYTCRVLIQGKRMSDSRKMLVL